MDSDSDDGLPSVGELSREVAGLRTAVAKQVSEALVIHECLRGLLRQNQLVSTACAAYFHGGMAPPHTGLRVRCKAVRV